MSDTTDSNNMPSKEETLSQAKLLVAAIENDEFDNANDIIRDLGKLREDSIFHQIGKLTRELHDSLKSFQNDDKLVNFAQTELPDARTRLNYVIEKTEAAANRTMDDIDNTLPLSDELANQAKALHEEWSKFSRKELSADEFRELYKSMMSYLEKTQQNAETIHANLTDVLLAQDYQDLTGQVIRRVIDLVGDVEESLIKLVKIATTAHGALQTEMSHEDAIKAEGPNVNLSKDVAVSNQDEVDDLLSELGF